MPRQQFNQAVFDAELGALGKLFKECGLDLGTAALATTACVEPAIPEPSGSTTAIEYNSRSIFPKPII